MPRELQQWDSSISGPPAIRYRQDSAAEEPAGGTAPAGEDSPNSFVRSLPQSGPLLKPPMEEGEVLQGLGDAEVALAYAPRLPPDLKSLVEESPPSTCEEDALHIKGIIQEELITDRAPISTWRPKQKYPSYVPQQLPPVRKPGRAYAIKVLDNLVELVSAFRLRYQVFESLGYLGERTNRCRLEIDEYDWSAIPFGAIAIDTGELLGTLRLITNCPETAHAPLIMRIVNAANDTALSSQVTRSRGRAMPSMISDHVCGMLGRYNVNHQEILELSRTIVHPSSRGTGVSRGLMEFGLAYARLLGEPVLIGGCTPEHVRMYARYGYEKLPGTALDQYDTVGRKANTVVCNTRRLPEPTSARVAMLLHAMNVGEPECILEEYVPDGQGVPRGIWHFVERYYPEGTNFDSIHDEIERQAG